MRYHELFNWHAGKYQQGLEGAMEICLPVSHYHLTGKTRFYIHRARKRSRIALTLWIFPVLPRRKRVIKEPLFLLIFFPFSLFLKKRPRIFYFSWRRFPTEVNSGKHQTWDGPSSAMEIRSSFSV